MKRSSLLLLCAGVLLAGKSSAQQVKPCGTDEARQKYIAKNPEILKLEAEYEKQIQAALTKIDFSKLSRTTSGTDSSDQPNYWYDIPIVIHVIHDYSAEYLTDEEIWADVVDWNRIFAAGNTADTASVIAPFKKWIANPHIRLHLATINPEGQPTRGITRHRSHLTYFAGDQAKFDGWDPASYINIWTINKMSMGHDGAAAYALKPSSGAAIPGSDGVIALYDYMANRDVTMGSSFSKSINHELGHCLNLDHPWGGTNQPEARGVTCADGNSDNVDDTPPTLGHYTDGCRTSRFTSSNPLNPVVYPQGNLYDTVCATNYFKVYPSVLTGRTDSLVNYPDTVNAENIMDYTYCGKMFTKGQVARMHAALHSDVAHRNNLWSDSNLVRVGVLKTYPSSPSRKVFAARPDLPVIPEFAVTTNNSNSTYLVKNQQYYTKVGTPLYFKNRCWNDTVTKLVWTFSNSATATVSQTNPTYGSGFNIAHSFNAPGWASLKMDATGNNTGVASRTWDKAVYVADASGVSGNGYFQEFDPAGDVDKWPAFNIYNNDFKWEPANVGYYDGYSMKYTGFDSRLNPAMRMYPTNGLPDGDFDDFYSVPFDLSGFGSGKCNLNFFTSAASRTSNALDVNDTFEVAYSTDALNWTKIATYAKGSLTNKGAMATAYTPSSLADWVPRTISLPTGARGSYVIFRFRYRPGTDHTIYDYSTGNNFYMDRVHVSAYPAEISGVLGHSGNIVVAPNPTTGNAFVLIKEAGSTSARILVTDITGKVVYSTTEQLSGTEASIEIPASALAVKGIYLVQVATGKEISTQKLVVE